MDDEVKLNFAGVVVVVMMVVVGKRCVAFEVESEDVIIVYKNEIDWTENVDEDDEVLAGPEAVALDLTLYRFSTLEPPQ